MAASSRPSSATRPITRAGCQPTAHNRPSSRVLSVTDMSSVFKTATKAMASAIVELHHAIARNSRIT
jgi:hypothetical protein